MRFDCFHNKKREPPYRGLMAGTVQAPLAAPSQRERGGPTCTDLREDSPSYMISHQGTLRPGAGRSVSQPACLSLSLPRILSYVRAPSSSLAQPVAEGRRSEKQRGAQRAAWATAASKTWKKAIRERSAGQARPIVREKRA
jgi:hypothetical protein